MWSLMPDMLENPMEDTQESFLGLLECFGAKKTDELHFHPLQIFAQNARI
jgi:hypothetical protein